ncbi:MAG: aldehyde ferredoxin oxidoreductase N-terminal domain-containing protein [Planctomycetota bacterium]
MSVAKMKQGRTVLVVDTAERKFELRKASPGDAGRGEAAYPFMGGEALCQLLLREDPQAMVFAAGPLHFFPGNKLSVGYVSPITGVPHYSFVGGRSAAQLYYLGLDAVVLRGAAGGEGPACIVIEGRTPEIRVRFESAADLPRGQRSALYWLIDRELGGVPQSGSVFTIGDGAWHGFNSANLACEGIYHAGRGGAGLVFARFAAALVLRGKPVHAWDALPAAVYRRFQGTVERKISPLIDKHCARLSRPDTGTIVKLHVTGCKPDGKGTLPARNAAQLGYAAAELGAGPTLLGGRDGHTACHWCEVRCRHFTWVEVDYAPEGRDAFLDDFEPAYAVCAMLDLRPERPGTEGLLELRRVCDRELFVPIEQMGLDVMDVGTALSALFEGVEKGLVPEADLPDFLKGREQLFGDLELAARCLGALRAGGEGSAAIRALGDGPAGLAAKYPALADIVFTCGPRTLGNAGHCNALWTFLMPFSRFFSHYSGQIYKIDEKLPPGAGDDEAHEVFRRVIARMIERELVCVVGNSLSMCAFVFNVFTVNGKGEAVDWDLFNQVLAVYGLDRPGEELRAEAERFLAQSLAFRSETGWRPPSAADYPARIFEAVSGPVGESPERCRALFDVLIDEWKAASAELMSRHGLVAAWSGE